MNIKLANDIEYPCILNVRVFKALKEEKGIDVISGKIDSLDDPDNLTFVLFHAIKEGLKYEGKAFDLTLDQVESLISLHNHFEIQNMILKELKKLSDYVNDNFLKKT
jgi:hypothetical protein